LWRAGQSESSPHFEDRRFFDPVAISSKKKIVQKMQPSRAVLGPTVCKGRDPGKLYQEDSMTHLIVSLFPSGDIPGGIGLWAFLAVGAVALFGIFLPVTTWLETRRKESEAFHKAETIRRIAEASPDSAKATIELLREQDRLSRIKSREGIKMGGIINIGVGIGLIFFLKALTGPQVALCGLIPGLIGVGMLVYVYVLASPIE
jgi:hypothetical protein